MKINAVGKWNLAAAWKLSRYDVAIAVCRRFNFDRTKIEPSSIHELGWIDSEDTSMNADKFLSVADFKFRTIYEVLERMKLDWKKNMKNERI